MRIEGAREGRRPTGSCARESLLADDQGLDIGVGTSRTAHVLEIDKLVLEIWTEEHEKGTCLFCSGVE